jgi:hypothetical protein
MGACGAVEVCGAALAAILASKVDKVRLWDAYFALDYI